MYEDCPCIVLAHPYKLDAYRTDKWTGWQRAGYGEGAAFMGGGRSFTRTWSPRPRRRVGAA